MRFRVLRWSAKDEEVLPRQEVVRLLQAEAGLGHLRVDLPEA